MTDWTEPITTTLSRGTLAAVAQALGYANNISDEAKAGRLVFLAALEDSDTKEEHEAAMVNATHERNFWSWKYERREAECEELAGRLREQRESCRNWLPGRNDRCGKPARYIVWGKLFDPEFLGPRCEDCAHDQVGSRGLSDPSYAIHHLPDSTQPNPIGDREQLQELLEAVEPFTVDGGISCGPEESERLDEVYDRIRDEQKAGS